MPGYRPEVDLLVPVKSLSRAKTRLRGAADNGVGDPEAHARLTVALVRDTISAARATPGVRRVFAVTSDSSVIAALAGDGVSTLPDHPELGLNEALRHGAALQRSGEPARPLGALQSDLPALRPAELAEALAAALAAFGAGLADRAFCPDAEDTGTTLLVCAAHAELDPRFGPGSAAAHRHSGALRLAGEWPGLRRDVDTEADLRAAAELGLGPVTHAVLNATTVRVRRRGL